MNTTGTKRIIELCHRMPKLQLLLHLSTAFCYCDKEVLYERVYDSPHNPHDLIRCAEWMDLKALEKITPDLLSPHPNTYTYSNTHTHTHTYTDSDCRCRPFCGNMDGWAGGLYQWFWLKNEYCQDGGQ